MIRPAHLLVPLVPTAAAGRDVARVACLGRRSEPMGELMTRELRLRSTADMWVSTVLTEMNNSPATSRWNIRARSTASLRARVG